MTNTDTSTPFSHRHIGVTSPAHVHSMLTSLEFGSLAELSAAVLPETIQSIEALRLPAALWRGSHTRANEDLCRAQHRAEIYGDRNLIFSCPSLEELAEATS